MSKRARQQRHIRALQAERKAHIAGLVKWYDDVITRLENMIADAKAKQENEADAQP